ncbi:MAG TPA: hypothetical protein VGH19_03945 [Verrucomicrobiae bacterium]
MAVRLRWKIGLGRAWSVGLPQAKRLLAVWSVAQEERMREWLE